MENMENPGRSAGVSPGTGNQDYRELFQAAVEDLRQIAEDHVKLAKEEIKTELHKVMKHMGLVAGASVILLIGFLLVSHAIALALAAAGLGPWGYVIVGGVYLLVGVITALSAVISLKKMRPLEESRRQLERDKSTLKTLRERHV